MAKHKTVNISEKAHEQLNRLTGRLMSETGQKINRSRALELAIERTIRDPDAVADASECPHTHPDTINADPPKPSIEN